jgi:hypothetical protein
MATTPLDDLLPKPQGLGAAAEPPPDLSKAPATPTPRTMTTAVTPPANPMPPGLGVGATTDVGKIAAEYAAQDSALMQRARTEGRQIANQRGLLNSSIAAQAAQNAILDRAIPMAQQESQQRFQAGLSAQEFGQAKNLSAQEFEQQKGLQEQRIFGEMDLAQLDADTRKTLLDMESGLKERLAQLDVDTEDRTNMMSMITSFNDQYQQAMRSILSNPDIGAGDRNALLTSAGDFLRRQTDMIESLYGFKINWSGGSITA